MLSNNLHIWLPHHYTTTNTHAATSRLQAEPHCCHITAVTVMVKQGSTSYSLALLCGKICMLDELLWVLGLTFYGGYFFTISLSLEFLSLLWSRYLWFSVWVQKVIETNYFVKLRSWEFKRKSHENVQLLKPNYYFYSCFMPVHQLRCKNISIHLCLASCASSSN